MNANDIAGFIALWFHVEPKDPVWFKLWLGDLPLELNRAKSATRGYLILWMVFNRYYAEGSVEFVKKHGIGKAMVIQVKQAMLASNNWRSLTPTEEANINV